MKSCAHCGAGNVDDFSVCRECGTELERVGAGESDGAGQLAADAPEAILESLDLGFEFVEGFSHPDWKAIEKYIGARVLKEEWNDAYNWVAEKWLRQLADDLGGGARVEESENFWCLSDASEETTRRLMRWAEAALEQIRNCLGSAAWTGYYGKHVLLMFVDIDDYFAYISYFYKEGSHALTSGVFLARGYAHVALPFTEAHSCKRVLAHELTHNLLGHLWLPLWLNEGLAVQIEHSMMHAGLAMDYELAERHRGFWNEQNIQSFWAGRSYNTPGDANELSYSLGHILVTLLLGKGPDFIEFVKFADWRDAGQDAAVSILGCDLGEIAGGFLGPGNWRPQRKAIADLLSRRDGGS